MESNQVKQQRKNINILGELRDIKHNICIIGILEEGKVSRNFEEIAENFPNFRKQTDIQVKEGQRTTNQMNSKRFALRYILIK